MDILIISIGMSGINDKIKHAKIFIEQGFLFYDSDCLKTTRKGMFIVDGISSKLFLIDFQEREMCNENKTLE